MVRATKRRALAGRIATPAVLSYDNHMFVLAAVGAAGLGLVWGWLLTFVTTNYRPPDWRPVTARMAGMLLLIGQVIWIVGPAVVPPLVIAIGVGALLRGLWQLRLSQLNRSNPGAAER